MGRAALVRDIIALQRGALFGWVPVCLAAGVGVFFGLTWEPSIALLWTLGAGGLFTLFLLRFLPETLSPFICALALAAIGVALAGWRTHAVADPVLGWRYYGPVEGRIVAIDRSQSDALRLTLDRVVLRDLPPARTPARVRVSLHGDRSFDAAPVPGLRVMTTAHLSPPGGPVEPGGFDFQRHSWFKGLGAVGYSRVPLLVSAPPDQAGLSMAIFRLRRAVSAHILAALPGDLGGFAVAITTGDRSAISQGALEQLRITNLAHLLAISGLHMGLLSGVVYGGLRMLLALIPAISLRLPTRSLAAGGALCAAALYLALSGGNVSTQRAFIMAAVALCAVMIGRRAISLRAVALAACIVLILRPEALTGPGFQMSFAATTALVAVFGWLRKMPKGPKWAQPIIAVVVSSGVAGLATAPVAAAHFNVVSHYGLLANLVSVPLMGILVIPAAVAALLLAPLGLDWICLWAMGLGLRWILWVADTISAWDGARSYVVGPGPWVLPLITLGFLTLILWRGRLRFVGLALAALGFALWTDATRPAVLISDTGTLVGQMTPAGRALSKPKGAGFVASNWLENDGEGTAQDVAAARWPEGSRVIHLSGKRAAARLLSCGAGEVVVSSAKWQGRQGAGCLYFGPDRLRRTGSVALTPVAAGWTIKTARQVVGTRIWATGGKPRQSRKAQ